MKLRRVGVAAMVAVVVGSVLTIVGPSGPVVEPPPVLVGEAPDAATAMVVADRQGSRVEVLGERTETRRVFANPGGTTTTEMTAVPVRVKQGGNWVGIDTRVVWRPDGSVGPRAADGDLALSGGGADRPLASMRKGGKTLALYWQGVLPEPDLAGNSVTYPDVFPGVDLVMLAERTGFQQHLVVKDATAARNPALASIKLRMRAEGLKVSVDKDGAIHAVDETGAEVFSAPPSTMWDAAGRTAPVGVSVVDNELIITPDAAFLADPTAKFPLIVDPTLSTFGWWGWATVLSGLPGSSFWWKSAAGTEVAQVGQCHRGDPEAPCNGIGEARAYFQYDTSWLKEREVLSASLDTTVTRSPDCSVRPHILVASNGKISDRMNWNNKVEGKAEDHFGFDAPAACNGQAAIGISIPARVINKWDHSGFFLRAAHGDEQLEWRKYNPGETFLRVTWNRPPNQPAGLGTEPSTPDPCHWCKGVPYVADDTIRLYANLTDPDGDKLRPMWRVKINGVENPWLGDELASGAWHDTRVNLRDHHDHPVEWWIHGADTAKGGPPAHGRSFFVDRVGVSQKPTVASELYPEDNSWHGGVGVEDTFVFGANGIDDINHYLYGWDDPPITRVFAEGGLGGPARVRLAPEGDGPRTLYVQSVDKAGHKSEIRAYRIYVRAGNGPLAHWPMEGNANDEAWVGDRDGTLHGGATFAPGAVGSGMFLNGTDGYVSARNAVRTTAGFTVSAWVKPAANNGARAVVSQDGEQYPGLCCGNARSRAMPPRPDGPSGCRAWSGRSHRLVRRS